MIRLKSIIKLSKLVAYKLLYKGSEDDWYKSHPCNLFINRALVTETREKGSKLNIS